MCLHGLCLLQVGLSTPDGDTYLVVPPPAAAPSTNTLRASSPMAASIARFIWYPRRFIAPPFLLRSVVARGSRSLLSPRRGGRAAPLRRTRAACSAPPRRGA